MTASLAKAKPSPWALAFAFALVYVSWGTTYLAIKVGVKHLPPALFGGTRIFLAGLIVLGYLRLTGRTIIMPWRDTLRMLLGGGIMFIGGNGLINVAEKTVDSGLAAVLVATTPVWLALLETLWPKGERLSMRGWLGVMVGLIGVLLLFAPKVKDPLALWSDVGPLLVIGSSLGWAIGTFVLRYGRRSGSTVTAAGWQMIFGGGGLTLLGLIIGETGQLTAESFATEAIISYFHLLIVGSLIGFVAYCYLLDHVSATMAGTYAYVNPVVAILVGWLLAGEQITSWIIAGMVVILFGVALVRTGGRKKEPIIEAPCCPEIDTPTLKEQAPAEEMASVKR